MFVLIRRKQILLETGKETIQFKFIRIQNETSTNHQKSKSRRLLETFDLNSRKQSTLFLNIKQKTAHVPLLPLFERRTIEDTFLGMPRRIPRTCFVENLNLDQLCLKIISVGQEQQGNCHKTFAVTSTLARRATETENRLRDASNVRKRNGRFITSRIDAVGVTSSTKWVCGMTSIWRRRSVCWWRRDVL